MGDVPWAIWFRGRWFHGWWSVGDGLGTMVPWAMVPIYIITYQYLHIGYVPAYLHFCFHGYWPTFMNTYWPSYPATIPTYLQLPISTYFLPTKPQIYTNNHLPDCLSTYSTPDLSVVISLALCQAWYRRRKGHRSLISEKILYSIPQKLPCRLRCLVVYAPSSTFHLLFGNM